MHHIHTVIPHIWFTASVHWAPAYNCVNIGLQCIRYITPIWENASARLILRNPRRMQTRPLTLCHISQHASECVSPLLPTIPNQWWRQFPQPGVTLDRSGKHRLTLSQQSQLFGEHNTCQYYPYLKNLSVWKHMNTVLEYLEYNCMRTDLKKCLLRDVRKHLKLQLDHQMTPKPHSLYWPSSKTK